MKPVIAITPGEPAGIGPDLCIQYLLQNQSKYNSSEFVLVTDPLLIKSRAQELGVEVNVEEFNPAKASNQDSQHTIKVIPISLNQSCSSGQLNPANAEFVLNTLTRACEGCLSGEFQALVTGPVQKSIINDAGFPFSGHTEFLADLCHQDKVVMMLATEGLRVALATTHLPLADVPSAITQPLLRQVISILYEDLQNKFGIASPHILVAGLNPHAGEGGHLGKEEGEVIEPVLEEFKAKGFSLEGPLPADTLFTDKYLNRADAVLAMYHDQGLPVLKYKGFGQAVNITLGLPIIRTSVDHGTALDLAGSGQANSGSLSSAIETAVFMSKQKLKNL